MQATHCQNMTCTRLRIRRLQIVLKERFIAQDQSGNER